MWPKTYYRNIYQVNMDFSLYLYIMCTFSRKPWLLKEDQIITQLVNQNEDKSVGQRLTWNDIADHLILHFPDSIRTGKQCRERYKDHLWVMYRWHNQLDPKIKKYQTWHQDQVDKLFDLQNQYGNKWSKIANELSGRTDNNVKNYFYSCLRRSLRKVNDYITSYKKRTSIKPFQMTVLSKILAISDEKNRAKLDIKADLAINLASEIKMKLIQLSKESQKSEINEQEENMRETLIRKIQEFNKNCKKRKAKKTEVIDDIDFEEPSQYLQNSQPQEASIFEKQKILPKKKVENNILIIEKKNIKSEKELETKKNTTNDIQRYQENNESLTRNCQKLTLKRKQSSQSNRSTDDFFNRSIFEGNKNLKQGLIDDNPFAFQKQAGSGFCYFGQNGPESVHNNCKMLDSLDMNEFYNRSDKNFLQLSLIQSSLFKRDSKRFDQQGNEPSRSS